MPAAHCFMERMSYRLFIHTFYWLLEIYTKYSEIDNLWELLGIQKSHPPKAVLQLAKKAIDVVILFLINLI